jgi:hypothetical protein
LNGLEGRYRLFPVLPLFATTCVRLSAIPYQQG